MRPIGLNQIEPFGMVLAATADTANLMKFAKDEDGEKLAMSLVFGSGQALLSKTYFQNVSDFLEAIANPDQDGAKYTSKLIASFVPQGIQRVANATDEWARAHYGTLEAIEANLPMVREGLPPARTQWGDPVPTRDAYLPFMSGRAASIVSPLPLGPDPEKVEPIDKWIWDNRESFPREEQNQRQVLPKPSKTVIYSSGHVSAHVELDPREYDRYQVLAGNELKDPGTGLGAKDSLNALVDGSYPSGVMQGAWDQSAPATQALMVRSMVNKFRKGAAAQLLQEFGDVAESREEQLKGVAQRLAAPAR
jgi:hypothetical protein